MVTVAYWQKILVWKIVIFSVLILWLKCFTMRQKCMLQFFLINNCFQNQVSLFFLSVVFQKSYLSCLCKRYISIWILNTFLCNNEWSQTGSVRPLELIQVHKCYLPLVGGICIMLVTDAHSLHVCNTAVTPPQTRHRDVALRSFISSMCVVGILYVHLVWVRSELMFALPPAVMLLLNNAGRSTVGHLQSDSGEPTAAPALTQNQVSSLENWMYLFVIL